jgi:phenylacetic acid degradation operon negative regulatory protein
VNARSALFDLYGDHLAKRGSRAPVASLVRLLAALGITEPATRTAVSRMVRQGWLAPVRCGPGLAGYALTPRASRRLDQAAARIYRQVEPAWDGQWHVLVVERIRDRARRGRVRAGLGYLGYAPLDETTWISPRPSVELDPLLSAERLRAERFLASYDGDARGPAGQDLGPGRPGPGVPAVAGAGARADRGGRPGRGRPRDLRPAHLAGA